MSSTRHQQLAEQIKQYIREGTYPPGHKLPSIRLLASEQQCSRATVIRAYEQLAEEQWIYGLDRSGYYVTRSGFDALTNPAVDRIDLASAAPAAEIFPYDEFQSCLAEAARKYRDQLFVYGTPQGLPPLLEEIRLQLEQFQVFTSLPRLFITSGVQQALSILTLMPFPSGRSTVMIEQPGYHLFIELLEALHIPVAQVQRTERGLDLEQVEHHFRTGTIKFFYIMPRFHNPLGTSLSAAEKKRLVQLAQQYDVYIAEDDYLADLEQEQTAASDPLYAFDSSDHIIYLKSYSKILFPGLRIGAAVVPDQLKESFSRYKKLLDIDSSVLSQAALHAYIQNGMFDRYRRQVREAYQQRIDVLHESLRTYRSDPLWQSIPLHQSVHTFIRLPHHFPTGALIRQLESQSILVDSADRHFLTDSLYYENILRLNVSNVPAEQITAAIRTVYTELSSLNITGR